MVIRIRLCTNECRVPPQLHVWYIVARFARPPDPSRSSTTPLRTLLPRPRVLRGVIGVIFEKKSLAPRPKGKPRPVSANQAVRCAARIRQGVAVPRCVWELPRIRGLFTADVHGRHAVFLLEPSHVADAETRWETSPTMAHVVSLCCSLCCGYYVVFHLTTTKGTALVSIAAHDG